MTRRVTRVQAGKLRLSVNQNNTPSGTVRLEARIVGDLGVGSELVFGERHWFLCPTGQFRQFSPDGRQSVCVPNPIGATDMAFELAANAPTSQLFGITLGGAIDFAKDVFTAVTGGQSQPPINIPGTGGPVIPATGGGASSFPSLGGGGAPCVFPFVRQADGSCQFDLDPGMGRGLPAGNGGGAPSGGRTADGLSRPTARSVVVQDCPTFADGKKGLLWMNALTGEVVCLPRGANGRGWGLIRKNKPRAKPFISAAMKKQLGVSSAAEKKAKEFAKLTGQVCESKSTRAARNARGK